MNILKERWMVVDGSVVVERDVPTKCDRQVNPIPTHPAVAFNVGDDIAWHIVKLHNNFLYGPVAISPELLDNPLIVTTK